MFLDKRRISVLTKVIGALVALAFVITLAIPLLGGSPGSVPQNRQDPAEQQTEIDEAAFKEQLAALQSLLKDEPSNAQAWVSLGNLQVNHGDMVEALKAYQESVKVDPVHSEGYYRLGQAYLSQGQQDEAIKQWEKFVELDSGSPLADSVSEQLTALKSPPTTVEVEAHGEKIE